MLFCSFPGTRNRKKYCSLLLTISINAVKGSRKNFLNFKYIKQNTNQNPSLSVVREKSVTVRIITRTKVYL